MGELMKKLEQDFMKLFMHHAKKQASKFKLSPVQKKRLRISLMAYYKRIGLKGRRRRFIVDQSLIMFEI